MIPIFFRTYSNLFVLFCVKCINCFLYFWEINLFILSEKFVKIWCVKSQRIFLRIFLGGKNGKRIIKTYF